MKIVKTFSLLGLALATACTTTQNPDEMVVLETVVHEDVGQEDSLLDPECASGDYDYVVRSIWPTTPDNAGVNLVLRSNSSLLDIVLVEYEVHACRIFNLTGGAFWFHSMDGFPGDEEEGDPRDASGVIVGETQYGAWIHRFHDFTLEVDGNVVGTLPEFLEMSVSDTAGSAAWLEMNYPMNPGDVHSFSFSASVRKDNAPTGQAHFSMEYAPTVAGKPSPNPFGRVSPWGVEIGTYPTIITLY
ncbi:MAG TPA: hypothetical protein VJB64_02500 [Patescibacteria group bacterium]|nr:hypothetical protein [Patescibacteria group bacterium]